MSLQNEQTLEAYQKTAGQYLANTIAHDNLDMERAKEKKRELQDFIKKSFSSIPVGSKVL